VIFLVGDVLAKLSGADREPRLRHVTRGDVVAGVEHHEGSRLASSFDLASTIRGLDSEGKR
jgi:hypothetical protein